MIKITYGTNEYFEKNIGDIYYCKNFTSARKFLIQLTDSLEVEKENIDYILGDLKALRFNNQAYGQTYINISCPYDDLYISIEVFNLI